MVSASTQVPCKVLLKRPPPYLDQGTWLHQTLHAQPLHISNAVTGRHCSSGAAARRRGLVVALAHCAVLEGFTKGPVGSCAGPCYLFAVDHEDSNGEAGALILQRRPSHVLVETALTPTHGAAPGNVLQVGGEQALWEAGEYAGYVRYFSQLAYQLQRAGESGVPAQQAMWVQMVLQAGLTDEQLAYVAALAVDAVLVNADRPKEVTLSRLYCRTTWADLDYAFGRASWSNYLDLLALGQQPQNSSVPAAHGVFAHVMLTERDLVMAHTIRSVQATLAPGKCMVTVVGGSHMVGLMRLFGNMPDAAAAQQQAQPDQGSTYCTGTASVAAAHGLQGRAGIADESAGIGQFQGHAGPALADAVAAISSQDSTTNCQASGATLVSLEPSASAMQLTAGMSGAMAAAQQASYKSGFDEMAPMAQHVVTTADHADASRFVSNAGYAPPDQGANVVVDPITVDVNDLLTAPSLEGAVLPVGLAEHRANILASNPRSALGLGVRRALLESALRLQVQPSVIAVLDDMLGPVPEPQCDFYGATYELYGTNRMLLASIEQDELSRVCSGWHADMWQVLEPMRTARPVTGGTPFQPDLVYQLRDLTLHFPPPQGLMS